MEARKITAKDWLVGAYELQDRYKDKKKAAYECFEEAEEEFLLADGVANILLESVLERLEERFYLNPRNVNKQFVFSNNMLSTEVINTSSDNVLQRARVSLSALKRKRDRYQSLCNQSLILEERIDVILDMLDQNEDFELTGDMCDHMKGQKAKMLTDDLESKISELTERLKGAQYETKEITEDADLHGNINKATQSKEHVDDYVAEFLRNRGVLIEHQVVPIESKKEGSMV